ncbi:hypothetical protein MKD41_01210 [Lutibacter sp. A64]|uniref:glycosyl hydrolase n=1 Tax=Lutibacter sp. A64 TaxID=2918526 RepID=UPI001F0684D9|nr:glycosyl hydrolase [Lutibacter sp. A64]UMB54110.1 hypothetical protein MKD41_01210 [Lutibacter sp. A64]
MATRRWPSNTWMSFRKTVTLDVLFSWTQDLLKQSKIASDVVIRSPSEKVYQIHQYTQDKDIYFFTNIHRFEATSFEAKFPVENKYPWVWNPETGVRTPFHYTTNAGELSISLDPLQSLLLIFEDEKPKEKIAEVNTKIKESKLLNGTWTVIGRRVDNTTFTWKMDSLTDFSKSTDSTQSTFGGEIIYKITINNDDDFTHIDLGDVNEGITELYVNGKNIGKRWYGKAVYPISGYLTKGENNLEIHYTSVLANYCKSLKNNPMSHQWTKRYNDKVSTGLEGPVRLLRY